MSRPNKPRLSVVRTEAPRPEMSVIERAVYRENDIRLAAEGLWKASMRLSAVPRYPDLADYRASISEQFEAAVKIMREALHE